VVESSAIGRASSGGPDDATAPVWPVPEGRLVAGAKPPAGPAIGPGVGALAQAAVAASSGDLIEAAVGEASAGSLVAGTVIKSLHDGHLAKASARDSVVV